MAQAQVAVKLVSTNDGLVAVRLRLWAMALWAAAACVYKPT